MRSQGAVAATSVATALACAAALVACGGGRRHGAAPSTATAAASVTSATTASQGRVQPGATPGGLTRYPIVLIHGMAGFAQVGPVHYFNGVADRLRAAGCEVLVTQSSPVHTVAHRAGEVRDQLLRAFPDPAVKLNLIGHSQGGLDARYLVASLGLADRVASVTTIGTPHRGSVVADLALGLIPGQTQAAIDLFLNGLGMDWNQITDLSTLQARAVFNPSNPDDPRVWYQSWSGRAEPRGTGAFARLNPVFYPTFPLMLTEGENDGIVSVQSSRWGEWRGAIPCDHAGEIGWPFGASGFDHLGFYEQLARDLARRGF